MSFTREEAHKFIDELFDTMEAVDPHDEIELKPEFLEAVKATAADVEVLEPEDAPEDTEPEEEAPARELPEGKRAVRTKSSGDRVYYLDDEKKTRQWVTSPDLLDELGFGLTDVIEMEDADLLKYQMGPVIYKVQRQ